MPSDLLLSLKIRAQSYQNFWTDFWGAGHLDEAALWRFEGSADSDVEIQMSARRGMVQFPDSQIIKTSTPFLKDGIMYSDFQNYWGLADAPVLVWKASSLFMNPSLQSEQLEVQRQLDPLRYAREFEAEFIDALEAFLPASWVEDAVIRGRRESAPVPGNHYVKAIDQSELRGDMFAMAVVHPEGEKMVVDLVRGWTHGGSGPVDLEGTVREIVDIAKRYGDPTLIGDQSARGWVEESIRRAGGHFVKSDKDTSSCYLESEPFFSQGRVELPDNAQLIRELKLLERRPRAGGKVVVDHPRGGHDDLAAALCRAIANAAAEAGSVSDIFVTGSYLPTWSGGQERPPGGPDAFDEMIENSPGSASGGGKGWEDW